MAAVNAIALLVGLLGIVGGGWLGFLLARRIRISESTTLGIGPSFATVWTWWLRFFVFLIVTSVVMSAVSLPILLLLRAIVGE